MNQSKGRILNNKVLGLLISAIAIISLSFLEFKELGEDSRIYIILTSVAIIFWMFKIVDVSFTAGFYLVSIIITGIATPAEAFSMWTGNVAWIVIGAFLIANAVVESGLCRRLAYLVIIYFVRSYRGLIISIFILSVLLSLIIPNPWPRCLILIEIVKEIYTVSEINKDDIRSIGLSVFVASIPTCFIFYTSAASMNNMVLQLADISISWVDWFIVMGFPGIILTVLVGIVFLIVYPQKGEFRINQDEIKVKLIEIGRLSNRELKTIIWLGFAILLWLTEKYHKIPCAWTTFGIAMVMAFPGIGGIIEKKSWSSIPLGTLIYLSAATAIGLVGKKLGITDWIACNMHFIIMPHNIIHLTCIIVIGSMLLHVFLGSNSAAISIIIPVFMAYTENSDLSPLACAFFCYTSVFCQYIFPYEHMNIFMGIGDLGMYDENDTIKMAFPLTILVIIVTVIIELPWWQSIGVLYK